MYRYEWNWIENVSHVCHCGNLTRVKIGIMKTIVFVTAQLKFWPIFYTPRRIFTKFGVFRCSRQFTAFLWLSGKSWILWRSAQGPFSTSKFHIYVLIWVKLDRELSHVCHCGNVTRVKIGIMKTIVFVTAQLKFWLIFYTPRRIFTKFGVCRCSHQFTAF